jgi:hypothetical protein
MQDQLTYADLAGRRRLRRYVFVAALIFILIGLLFGWSGWQRTRARIAGTPSEVVPGGESTDLIAGSERDEANPILEAEGCPVDPESWALLDVYIGDNYKRIEPNCVYEGLRKVVAWHMLERLGYSKLEAAEQLGLTEVPWEPAQSIKGLTNTKGPIVIPLEMEWAPHPAFRTWVVDAEGQPALAYSLRGCYRTRTIVGNKAESWGHYPVICVLAYDRDPGWTVTELGEQRFSVDSTTELPLRQFVLFGYSGERWVLLGEPSGRQITIEEPSTAGEERERVTARYGATPWDAVWLEATFGLTMRPLPDDWQHFGTDPDVIHSITTQLDDALQEFGDSP